MKEKDLYNLDEIIMMFKKMENSLTKEINRLSNKIFELEMNEIHKKKWWQK